MDFALVAPGTPPRFSETDPEKIFYSEPLSFPNYPGNTELFWRNLVIGETRKFAVYELSLRDWEEREKRRQRALAEIEREISDRNASIDLAREDGDGCFDYSDEEGHKLEDFDCNIIYTDLLLQNARRGIFTYTDLEAEEIFDDAFIVGTARRICQN